MKTELLKLGEYIYLLGKDGVILKVRNTPQNEKNIERMVERAKYEN